MRSAAAAIGWELRRRHRWGLWVLACYLLILGIHKFLIVRPGESVEFGEEFAFAVIVPMTATFIYFMAVFSYGLDGDLAGRQSIYPSRTFTLPVTTASLAGWPMLYGAGAMAILWLATRFLSVWPSGVVIPVIWPALLAASLLAWTQALTWMPYALPGLRVIVTVLWMAAINAVVMVALQYKLPEGVMLAILAPHLPLAYLVAHFAIGRARRGDVPDWRGAVGGRTVFGPGDSPAGRPFSSAARAQVWFEWRRYGQSLPALVAILLPFELAMIFIFRETPDIVVETLILTLFTPPFMAAFVAATVGKSNPDGRDSYGMTPFTAARPMTGASLIASRLKAAIWSTLAAWLLVGIAIPLALKLSGTSEIVLERMHRVVEIFGMPRAVALLLVGICALLGSTWKQLVQAICIGLSGREWIVKASVFGPLALLTAVGPVSHWISRSRGLQVGFWNAIPSIAAVLVCLKLSAASWIVLRLQLSRLLTNGMLIIGAVAWASSVFALYFVLVWIFSTLIMRAYFLMLVAILVIPLTRLSAAPLALAWNRHR